MRSTSSAPRSSPAVIRRRATCAWFSVAKSLERIGEHAKNVGEHVVYAAMGEDVRHASVNELERLLQG